MRLLVIALFVVGAGLIVYGWWGIFTTSGRKKYDEMAGLIPFYLGIAGIVLVVTTGVAVGVVKWRAARSASVSTGTR